MATYGKGLICMPMSEEYVRKLKIPQQDVQKILKYFGYTASQIKRAIRLAANKQQDLQFMDVPYIVDAAKEILESGKPEVGVVMKKNKEIDEHDEQVVHELVEGEKYAVSNL
mgnify:CR=1 FL=1